MPIRVDQIIARMDWAVRNQLAEHGLRADGLSIVIRRRPGDVAVPGVAVPGATAPEPLDAPPPKSRTKTCCARP